MRLIFLSFLLLVFVSAFSQKSKKQPEIFYVFDSNWEPCSIEKAVYLTAVKKKNDTTFQNLIYHFSGPLISFETYKDEYLTMLNGFIAFYDHEGRVDSSGYTKNNKRDRTWYFYDDTLAITFQKDYEDGKLVREIDLVAKRKEEAKKEKIPDSFLRVEKEAEFKGGTNSWIKYLQKNIQFPKRAENLSKSGKVMIGFVVDTAGYTKDIYIVKSIEYSLDNEAWRLIEESPKWEPAIQDNRKVKAYRRQPITFAF